MSIRRLSYVTLDVFTTEAFGGNPLAVVLESQGLRTETMQAIAREFGYSETTFVVPSGDPEGDVNVRIFTPGVEIPFAGHPTIGTAMVLASAGYGRVEGGSVHLRLGLQAGLVPVIVRHAEPAVASFIAPLTPTSGETVPAARVSDALGLGEGDIIGTMHPPTEVSAGLPFLAVQLASLEALARASVVRAQWGAMDGVGVTNGVCAYVPLPPADGDDAHRLQVRVFIPTHGPDEDPATGSAAAGLTGFLAALDRQADGTLRYSIDQGVEMGRPSRITTAVRKAAGGVVDVAVEGSAVVMMEGMLRLPTTEP